MLIHITPALPPAVSGVGDYAAALGRALLADHGIKSEFYLGRPGGSSDELLDFLGTRATTVLLEYSGYGYAAKGCPFWLVRCLEQWKRANPTKRLITIFHELAASGRPWQSPFWLRPVQQMLFRRLFAVSSAVLTSRDTHKRELSRGIQRTSPSITVLPIFSAFGEPTDVLPSSSREKTVVVFGTPGRRRESYRNGMSVIEECCTKLGITRVLDIGPGNDIAPAAIGGVAVTRCGILDAQQIEAHLRSALLGVIDYPVDILGKSSLFAAYSANGLAIVVVGSPPVEPEDGLQASVHYFAGRAPESIERAESCARAAFEWYREHRLAAHVQWVASQVEESAR